MHGVPLAWVTSFKYLGSIFDSSATLDSELRRRVQQAAHAFRQLESPFFRQRCIPLPTRVAVYNCMVISSLLYGSESWALSAAQLHYLETFHNNRLRKLIGIRRARDSSNAALHSRSHTDTIEVLLDRRQLGWLGHLARMPPTRLAKQMLYSTGAVGSARRVGRPDAGTKLCDTYAAVVRKRMSSQSAVKLARGTTWLSLSQNRAAFRLHVRGVRTARGPPLPPSPSPFPLIR